MGLKLGQAVSVERVKTRTGWSVRKLDSFGNICDKPFYTKSKTDAMLSAAQMRQEIKNGNTPRR